MCHSAFRPYRYFGHAINLVLGKYSLKDDPGSIPHSQALSTALSGTLGLGNIAGVAIAISVGGPGSIFWMWVTAIVGVSTKFLYRLTLGNVSTPRFKWTNLWRSNVRDYEWDG